MRSMIALLFVAVLTGCGEPSQQSLQPVQPLAAPLQTQDRVEVKLIGQFSDRLAYYDKRGIYTITDHKTGQEYIGISGIGITEVGRHGCGKGCTRSDER